MRTVRLTITRWTQYIKYSRPPSFAGLRIAVSFIRGRFTVATLVHCRVGPSHIRGRAQLSAQRNMHGSHLPTCLTQQIYRIP